VSFHIGIARWVVNGAAVGTFDTAAEAAVALKNSCHRVEDKNTKKQKPGKKFSVQKKFSVLRGGKKRKVSPKQLLIRIRCLSKIYNRGGQLHMPADVDSFMAHNIVAHGMHTAEPTMQMVAMHLKYKPWMDAVHAAWRACSHTSNFQRSSRSGRMWMALVAAVRLIDEDPVDQKWVQHAGRKVCRHSGGAQVMVSLGILRVGGRGLAPVRLCKQHLKPGHHLLLGKRSSAKLYLHVVGCSSGWAGWPSESGGPGLAGRTVRRVGRAGWVWRIGSVARAGRCECAVAVECVHMRSSILFVSVSVEGCAPRLDAQHISIKTSKLHHVFRELDHGNRDVTLMCLC